VHDFHFVSILYERRCKAVEKGCLRRESNRIVEQQDCGTTAAAIGRLEPVVRDRDGAALKSPGAG
jgi:hypothetical protein